MRHGRWYPSGVRLADGRIPIVSGLDETGDPSTNNMNEEVELFTPPAARGGQGSLSLLGSTDYTPSKGLPPTGETYPHMFAMPSGRALVAGPDKTQTWFLNTPGTNPWWTPAPAMSQRRNWGTAVPMPAGSGGSSKVMALGGTSLSRDPSTNSTEVFDEANPGQGWLAKPSLNIGRGHANTVLLPDGSMVEVGGGLGRDDSFTQSPQHAATPEQRQIELWDRETGKWKLGPAQAENRAYHSTALLLADGRVLSAGDEVHGGGASDLGEIYEPPYLHTGVPRPTITSAPATIKVGARFGVGTADEDVTRATLVAPGSVTHAVDMNQRVIELDLTRRKGCVDLAAPPNGKVAPPGWYMLFLLNGSGAPSVAKFVRLTEGGATPAQCTEPEVPADTEPPSVKLVAPASPVAGEVRLEADASDNVGVASVRFKAGDQLIADEDPSDNRVDWDTTKIANGPHVLTAVASDAAGNSTTSSPVTVTVKNADKTPPTVTFVRPANGSTVSETIDVVASAADDQAMAQVQFKLDGENLGQPQTSAPYTVRWATRNGAQGTHELTAVARDVADNSSQPAKVTVTVNNPPPPKEPPPVEVPKATQPPPRLAPPVAPPAAPVTPPRVQVPPNAAPRIARLKLAGTRLSFRLSEAARVRVTFERRRPSRRGRATRYSRLRTSLTLRGRAGANSVRFDARRRGFRVGSYRLTALARDARGKRGPAARAGFRVVAVKSSRRARRAALIDGAFGRLAPFAALRP